MNIDRRGLLVSGASAAAAAAAAVGLACTLPVGAEALPSLSDPFNSWSGQPSPQAVLEAMHLDPDIIWIGSWRDEVAMNAMINRIDSMHMSVDSLGVPQADAIELTLISSAAPPLPSPGDDAEVTP